MSNNINKFLKCKLESMFVPNNFDFKNNNTKSLFNKECSSARN